MTVNVAARELGIPREKLGRWVFEGEPKSELREIPGRALPLLSVLEQDVIAQGIGRGESPSDSTEFTKASCRIVG